MNLHEIKNHIPKAFPAAALKKTRRLAKIPFLVLTSIALLSPWNIYALGNSTAAKSLASLQPNLESQISTGYLIILIIAALFGAGAILKGILLIIQKGSEQGAHTKASQIAFFIIGGALGLGFSTVQLMSVATILGEGTQITNISSTK